MTDKKSSFGKSQDSLTESEMSTSVDDLKIIENSEKTSLEEQLRVAKDNVEFLKSEHAYMLQGLHDEIEQLHHKCRGKS